MGAAWRDAAEGEEFDRVLDDGARRPRARAWKRAARSACSRRTQADALAGAGLLRVQPQPRHARPSSTAASSRRARTTSASRRSRACARPASPSAAAASSAWARSRRARCGMLQQLSSLDPHPESVPINLLVRVEGTPLGERPAEDPLELVRTIATARILMPRVLRPPQRGTRVALRTRRRRSVSWPAPTRCFSATCC